MTLSYWKKQLADAPALLDLPTDRPRPAVQTFKGGRESFSLSKELSEVLVRLGQDEGVTLFVTLLAAFQTLLYRYSGQLDIAVGSPVATRNRHKTQRATGFFVNTLVLRTNLEGNPSFRELLARVKKIAREAYDREDLPFKQLVEELKPEGDLSYFPLFQVVFILQNELKDALEFPSLMITPMESINDGKSKFDLTLIAENTEHGLFGEWEYNTNLFDNETIKRLSKHYQVLLEGILEDADLQLSELPILEKEEQQRILVEWNKVKDDYPESLCLHHLVERQVRASPNATAVVFEEQQITYDELNYRANQVAHYLSSVGISPEIPVVLFMELSLDVAVVILGILKSGGTLVPLDPDSPQERIAFILKDSQAHILLTQQKLLNRLPETQTNVVAMDMKWEKISRGNAQNRDRGVASHNLAYILYTSGSTGKPKGVMLSHYCCCTRELWEQRTYPMTKNDSILMKSSWSSKEFFWPLLAGARIVICRQGGHQDSAYLARLISEEKITFISVVPSLLKFLLGEPDFKKCSSLRYIFSAGEAMSVDIRDSFFEANFQAELCNIYGLNEANYATVWHCSPSDKSGIVPIGRQTDMQIYLLDQNLKPVPVGVKGEICISGVGLARGYLNRPEITAERFIPHPFSTRKDDRLFKTGDLGRYRRDGSIEYLGRIDHQVKIRGNRVELGEVESVLRNHPSVDDSVVILKKEKGFREKHLAAYITYSQGRKVSDEILRDFLRQRLPNYMIPSFIVTLDSIPRTFNGKVDRLALPQAVTQQDITSPRNNIERQVAGVWCEVLNLNKFGVFSNFFELGGYSLIATQIILRLNEIFQIRLSQQDLFEEPTVAGLAERIEVLAWTSGRSLLDTDHQTKSILTKSPKEPSGDFDEFVL